MQTEQLLCWSGMTELYNATNKEHSTSGSNEENRTRENKFMVLLTLLLFILALPKK